MKPIDYIFKNLGCINTTVLKQLITDAGETVSEEIYDYLKETPMNTNTAILKQMGLDIERSGEDESENRILIFDGTMTFIVTQGPYRPIQNQPLTTITQTFNTETNKLIFILDEESFILTKGEHNAYIDENNGINLAINSNGEIGGSINSQIFPITIDSQTPHSVQIYSA